jgi:hypothetical protein
MPPGYMYSNFNKVAKASELAGRQTNFQDSLEVVCRLFPSLDTNQASHPTNEPLFSTQLLTKAWEPKPQPRKPTASLPISSFSSKMGFIEDSPQTKKPAPYEEKGADITPKQESMLLANTKTRKSLLML